MNNTDFKVGDRIRRISCFEKWAPEGFETIIVRDRYYIDNTGHHVAIVPCQWELVLGREVINNYQIY